MSDIIEAKFKIGQRVFPYTKGHIHDMELGISEDNPISAPKFYMHQIFETRIVQSITRASGTNVLMYTLDYIDYDGSLDAKRSEHAEENIVSYDEYLEWHQQLPQEKEPVLDDIRTSPREPKHD